MAAAELAGMGINRTTLSQLVSQGYVERPVRGVYHVPGEGDDQRVYWAAISLAYDCVFCLMSAASFHGLTEESAGTPEVAIPVDARVPQRQSLESRVDFHRWPGAALEADVETVDIQGVAVRITSPARTVVDMFRHSTLNSERGFPRSVLDTSFLDCLTRYLSDGDQDARSAELRRIAIEHGCWERVCEIVSVIQVTRARSMAY